MISGPGTNLFTKSLLTTQTVHVALKSSTEYARYAVQLTGAQPDTTVGVYANGCQLVNGVTGEQSINTAADGLAPVWISPSAVGAGIVQLGKLTSVNLNEPTQSTMVLSSVTGTYVAGETVTGSSSGATAVVVAGGTTSIVVKTITGTFTTSDSVVGGTSAATGTWVSNTVLSGIDQTFTLNAGTVFFPTSAIVTNASISLTTASGIQIWTLPGRKGTEVASTAALSSLTTSAKALAFTINDTTTTVGSPLYVTLTTQQGAAAIADIYLYGYIFS